MKETQTLDNLEQASQVEQAAPVVAASLKERGDNSEALADPVFILAPPRSFSSVVGAMVGQHPQMYGCPELQIFGAETMEDWWNVCSRATFPMVHGLLRAVAQLCFGAQTEETVNRARGWLRRRSHLSTGMIVELLAQKVHPLVLVEKSPSIVYRLESMQRAYSMFPQARFIHLLRHPRGHGESVMKGIRELAQVGPVPQWWLHLASFPELAERQSGVASRRTGLDPQNGWYALHMNICEFLETVPQQQKLRVRGEDLLNDPENGLRQIAGWLGLRTDPEAITEMKHPERSVYACYGPPGARLGNDGNFLSHPALRPDRAKPQSLNGPLNWREDGQGFLPEVRQLAQQFGYV